MKPYVSDHTSKETFTCCPGSKRTLQENAGSTEVRRKAHVDSGSLGFTSTFEILNASMHWSKSSPSLCTSHLLQLVCTLPWPETWKVGERLVKKKNRSILHDSLRNKCYLWKHTHTKIKKKEFYNYYLTVIQHNSRSKSQYIESAGK